ncbi:MAG: hypothetical protein WDM76_13265 [Limisphaerales bacterium]
MTANVSIVTAHREDVVKIPNGALRFRPPDATNAPAASGTNAPANFAGGGSGRPQGGFGGGRSGGFGGFGGGGHGARMNTRTVYTLSGDAKNRKLQPVQIKVGISDGISTEVLEGLKEGDQIVTGLVTTGTASPAQGANPFGGGGGFPRR